MQALTEYVICWDMVVENGPTIGMIETITSIPRLGIHPAHKAEDPRPFVVVVGSLQYMA